LRGLTIDPPEILAFRYAPDGNDAKQANTADSPLSDGIADYKSVDILKKD
jgi:hypothetical protein